MKKATMFALVFISILNYNCSSNDTLIIEENDYLIFGHFYGMCVGDGCVVTYKLTDNALYEDVNHNYSGTDLSFEELDNQAFEQVNDLKNAIPSKLLSETESVFGCPDCVDQGGLFIAISKNGVLKSWRIDQDKNEVPSYLHNFMDLVNGKIELITN